MTTEAAQGQSDELAEFGYKQELDRSIGRFASFAAGVSYISILTGTFQLFYFGFAFGGPAYWWTWPMVFVGQLMVALCFAELAANYPVAGSIYNWGKKLASATVAWLGGWMMLTASIVTIAAVALAYQITLPQIDSAFQFYGDGTGENDFAANAVILGSVLIIFTTVINALGVKLMSRINSTGVFIELIAAVLLIILLAANITRGPDVLFETQGLGEGHDWGYLGAFLAASLASAYVMYGFDTASSLGEETREPRKTAPLAIMRAVIASFILGGCILLFAILSVSNINSPEIGVGGLQFVVLDVLGDTVGKIFLICVVIAITVCCLAVQTATIRMIFAMARDNNLPLGERLAKVHPKTKTPIVPAVITGLLAILILVVNINQPQIFLVITSIGIIMIYIAYMLVTVPMLRKRLRGEWPPKDAKEQGFFTLGKWGLPINIIAVSWGAFMALNLAWPRKDIYNATEPFHWYLQYGAFLFIGVVFFGGLAYYWFVQRHKTGVLASHALGTQQGPRRRSRRPRRPPPNSGSAGPREEKHGSVRLRRRRRRHRGLRGRGAPVRGPRDERLPAGGRAVRRRRPGDPRPRSLDGAARVRLRLGLPDRAPGAGQLVHAPRAGEGARRLLVAQLLHRLLDPGRGPRRVGLDGLRGLERARSASRCSSGSRTTAARATTTAARAR